MFNLILEWYRSWRMNRANRAEISDNRCVSCDSSNLDVKGEGVYVCNACGYEGGSGHAKLVEERRFAQFDKLSPEERRRSALDDLQQARHLLLSGIGYLKAANSLSQMDLVGLGGGTYEQGAEKLNEFLEGVKLLQEAQSLLKDATYKLHKHPQGSLSFDKDIDYSAWIIDLYLDNPLSDFRSHQRIQQTQEQAHQILQSVESTLRYQFREPI